MAYVQYIQQAASVCLIYHLPSDGSGAAMCKLYTRLDTSGSIETTSSLVAGASLCYLLQGDDDIGMSAKYTVHATGAHPRPANGSVSHHISSANDSQDCQPELPLEPPDEEAGNTSAFASPIPNPLPSLPLR